MTKNSKIQSFLAMAGLIGAFSTTAIAKENIGIPNANTKSKPQVVLANNCLPSTSKIVMELNNVRTTLLGGGDFWWDLNSQPKYEIPKNSGKHSVFAGSIWMGGLTPDGNLKVAAMTYRQGNQNDFWSGPLDGRKEIENASGDLVSNPDYGQTNVDICNDYDDHFSVTLEEVSSFYNDCQKAGGAGGIEIPESIKNWPGNGVDGELPYILAPFVDLDDDGIYEWQDCEYPAYKEVDNANTANISCDDDNANLIFGDQTIFWVYNDRGNIHSESGTEAIGVEIRAQAFAYTTNDEINDMTFYNFRIINYSPEDLEQTYFGTWVDSDVGFAFDDYVGCDVQRGLGYTYNGDGNDEGANGYGQNSPALGLDFFKGPKADVGDGIDNDKDGCVDCTYGTDADGNQIEIPDSLPEGRETIIMSKFVYYNNDFSNFGNPTEGQHHYNYLRGRWKNGSPLTYGVNGTEINGEPCDYMFPEDTDPAFSTPWTEQTAGNTPADRRFLTSAGPFTLEPNVVNDITTGLVWARASSGGPFASVAKLKAADDKAQALFDNCFKVLDGPTSPNLDIVSLDQELVFQIIGVGNNENESYEDEDVTLIETGDFPIPDNKYRFEGYQIFQLKDETVVPSDIYDASKARLVFQTDIKNFRKKIEEELNASGEVTSVDTVDNLDQPITGLINWEYDQSVDNNVPKDKTIQASNTGIKHSFKLSRDAFTNQALVNNKQYYYMAISYAYNEYMKYQPDVPYGSVQNIFEGNSSGQKRPYLAGRKTSGTDGISIYKARPRKTAINKKGDYGVRPAMTRIQGAGSNSFELDFTPESEAKVLKEYCVAQAEYKEDKTPINLYVIDPFSVPNAKFMLELYNTGSTGATKELKFDRTSWRMIKDYDGANPDTVYSKATLLSANDQIIPEWGIAIEFDTDFETPLNPESGNATNGLIGWEITYDNPNDEWMTFYFDGDYPQSQNWILSGTAQIPNRDFELTPGEDQDNRYWIQDVRLSKLPDVPTSGSPDNPDFADPRQRYKEIAGGGIAPYWLTSPDNGYPRYVSSYATNLHLSGDEKDRFKNLSSVKIVFTKDRSNWTRVPVIEAHHYVDDQDDYKDLKDVRKRPSVDKDGNPDNSGTKGWSWFPGYALDKSTGQRLNMMIAEDSALVDHNGNDMMFNPTDEAGNDEFERDQDRDNLVVYPNKIAGGRHYFYVMSSQYAGDNEKNHELFDRISKVANLADNKNGGSSDKNKIFEDAMWVGVPMLAKDKEWLSNDVAINIDIAQELTRWGAATSSSKFRGCAETEMNKAYPAYTFKTDNITITNDLNDRESTKGGTQLDLVNVVPNPYYGLSSYEKGPLDYKVRITNLPKNSVITILNANGSLIRTLRSDDGGDLDWNLKNNYEVAIASGIYFIHITSPEGERTIKWFGTLRKLDLDTF
ncbi:MAG: T9SS type A sorting domain-containing protein [Flavobacteriales bacterium]|jgi:hypothetical protein|nr:T9SS type A sorting domain-containing protein [Flavobacteriales bacterium]